MNTNSAHQFFLQFPLLLSADCCCVQSSIPCVHKPCMHNRPSLYQYNPGSAADDISSHICLIVYEWFLATYRLDSHPFCTFLPITACIILVKQGILLHDLKKKRALGNFYMGPYLPSKFFLRIFFYCKKCVSPFKNDL